MELMGPMPIETVGKLPEILHQPGMRIRRQPGVFAQFVAEVIQMLFGQAAFEKRPRIDAGRRVALEINQVAGLDRRSCRGRNG